MVQVYGRWTLDRHVNVEHAKLQPGPASILPRTIYDDRRNNPDDGDWREAKDIFEFLTRERVFAPFSDSPRVYRRCQWQLPLTGWVVVVDDVIDIH